MADDLELFRSHLETLDRLLAAALASAEDAGSPFDGVIFHAGREAAYHRDDRPVRFYPDPHFHRWVPTGGPDFTLLARPGETPVLVRVLPRDFWFDTAPPPHEAWQEALEVRDVATFEQVEEALGGALGKPPGALELAFVGESRQAAVELGLNPELVEPPPLMAPLDWHRAIKTPWEVAQTEAALAKTARGFAAAREAFLEGHSERQVYHRYLGTSGQLEAEVPYDSIVAFDEKSAILHYQHKRGEEAAPGRVLLLDAGAAHRGYAADITRTWTAPGVDETFTALVEAMDAAERRLVALVTHHRPYPEIHHAAHREVAEILANSGISKLDAEGTLNHGLTRTFLPHGVGHHLGLQVHDVGGHQRAPEGGTTPPPPEHAFLRNTRTLEAGHLVTIEPGIYFIPMLLEPLRASPEGRHLDWDLIDRLSPLGGVRIEDNVLCTEDGPRDLSRPAIPFA